MFICLGNTLSEFRRKVFDVEICVFIVAHKFVFNLRSFAEMHEHLEVQIVVTFFDVLNYAAAQCKVQPLINLHFEISKYFDCPF